MTDEQKAPYTDKNPWKQAIVSRLLKGGIDLEHVPEEADNAAQMFGMMLVSKMMKDKVKGMLGNMFERPQPSGFPGGILILNGEDVTITGAGSELAEGVTEPGFPGACPLIIFRDKDSGRTLTIVFNSPDVTQEFLHAVTDMTMTRMFPDNNVDASELLSTG